MNTNCVFCANATQQRLLGQDITAIAKPSMGYGTPSDLLPSAPYGFEAPTTAANIETQLIELGHGATGVVRIDQGHNLEHVINITNRNGQVYFIDGQSGQIVIPKQNIKMRLGIP